MRLQTFASVDDLTVTGTLVVHKDRFARRYVDGVRVAIVRQQGLFTALLCADGATRYVMTSDWNEVEHLPDTDAP
jgi:hypothetical protein